MPQKIARARTRASLNVRAGPSAREKRLGTLPAGESVEVLGEEGAWVRIRFGDTEGFAFRRYLELDEAAGEEPAVTKDSREPPGRREKRRKAKRKPPAAMKGARKPPILRSGSTGDEVKQLQELLHELGYAVQPDGMFGPRTAQFVSDFQKTHDLPVTGEVDAATRDALTAARRDAVAESSRTPGADEEIGEEEEPPIRAAHYTISDQPAQTLAEDRLGFRDSVLALVEFLRSRETRAPLAIAVCAPWGRGKTSFMRMVDRQLEDTSKAAPMRFARAWYDRFFSPAEPGRPARPVRFATVWFNPWKYDDQQQVWAALVAAITGRIRSSLGIAARLQFEARRLGMNLRRKFDFALGIRLLFLIAVWGALILVALQPSMQEFSVSVVRKWAGNEAGDALQRTPIGALIPLLAACVLGYQFYFKVVVPFNQGLLDYLRQTDYRDKVGTLSRFEAEMRELNDSMPEELKIVVFIDDLDRCKTGILSEIIESLQLLEVSRKCIFVLGMDLNIVIGTVEHEYADLNPEVKRGTDGADSLQHGRGYQFLEKIVQVRLGVPEYSEARMRDLAASLSRPQSGDARAGEAGEAGPESGLPGPAPDGQPPAGTPDAAQAAVAPPPTESTEAPTDSPQVTEAIESYGAAYFRNPRRLKRFVNTFRMHVYLAQASGLDVPVDRLARFLVLTERWPGLVEHLRGNPSRLDAWLAGETEDPMGGPLHGAPPAIREILSDETVQHLFHGSEEVHSGGGAGPIDAAELQRLCDWYGFAYYR